MKAITAQFFECKIQYEKVQEDGLQKKTVEKYVVNALTHSEAEERIIEEMSAYISGEFDVKGIVPAAYKEIFLTEAGDPQLGEDLRWYKAKVQFLTFDEKTDKEKRTTVCYLVEAASVSGACRNIDEVMRGSMVDYVICAVQEQAIEQVFTETSAQ